MAAVIEGRDEAKMIDAILAGDVRLFHDLVRPYERSVYVLALSMLKNEADAEDTAQEAFLKAFRKLGSFRSDSKFSTWLVSITLNEARSRLRRSRAAKIESLDEPENKQRHISPAVLTDWREIPSEALERREVRLILQEAIVDLPNIYREVFLLRDVEELSVNESAEALGISVASVKVRLHRARIMLQKKLAPLLKSAAPPKRRWLTWS